MTPDQARRVARRHQTALRARAKRIRVRVATLAGTFFVVAFLIVYVQLASGHDPALVATAEHRTASHRLHAHVSTSTEKTSELTSRSTELERNENPSPSKSSSSSSEASTEEEPTTLTTSQS